MTTQFSPEGNYLAVAACTAGSSTGVPVPTVSGSMYGIRIVDVDTGLIEWSLDSAHYAPIYRIR